MALSKTLESQIYTYADLLDWDEDFRAELHDGAVFVMAPPVTDHQRILVELLLQIASFLKGKQGNRIIS